jgi:hypothetical protein
LYLDESIENGDEILGGDLLTEDDPQLVYTRGQGSTHLKKDREFTYRHHSISAKENGME